MMTAEVMSHFRQSIGMSWLVGMPSFLYGSTWLNGQLASLRNRGATLRMKVRRYVVVLLFS